MVTQLNQAEQSAADHIIQCAKVGEIINKLHPDDRQDALSMSVIRMAVECKLTPFEMLDAVLGAGQEMIELMKMSAEESHGA